MWRKRIKPSRIVKRISSGIKLPIEILRLKKRVDFLEKRNEYMENEISRLNSLMRYVLAPIIKDLPITKQTKGSFDFQWDKVPAGRNTLEDEQFRKDVSEYICRFTGLPKEWFFGKKIADVGCGSGRYSYGLCKLGSEVTGMDQSEYGLKLAQKACKQFKNFHTKIVDLLKPISVKERFDLVWSFGVLHHTGDTYSAFKNASSLVKPGGYLFLMIYGEPRRDVDLDYEEVNEYENWRRKTKNMSLDEKLDTIKKGMREKKFRMAEDKYVHGYFDAISPTINDLYTWEEIVSWLKEAGFIDIKKTIDNNRNHHLIARKAIV